MFTWLQLAQVCCQVYLPKEISYPYQAYNYVTRFLR